MCHNITCLPRLFVLLLEEIQTSEEARTTHKGMLLRLLLLFVLLLQVVAQGNENDEKGG